MERDHGGRTRFRIRSFSRPVGLAALWPALARAGQTAVNRRYLAARNGSRREWPRGDPPGRARRAEATFDLLHDNPRRLSWDAMLRRAYTIGGVAPALGVEAVCQGRWRLGGLSFRVRYVTFRRPELAAVTLAAPVALFESWAASIHHRPLGPERHEIVYTLTLRCRPKLLAPISERLATLAFRWETA